MGQVIREPAFFLLDPCSFSPKTPLGQLLLHQRLLLDNLFWPSWCNLGSILRGFGIDFERYRVPFCGVSGDSLATFRCPLPWRFGAQVLSRVGTSLFLSHVLCNPTIVALVNSLGSVIFSTSDGLFFRPRVGYVRSTEMRIFGANGVLHHSVSGGLIQAVAVALLPYSTRGKMTIDEDYDDNVPGPDGDYQGNY